MTHTILLAVGTSSTWTVLHALQQIRANSDPERVSAVLAFAESPDFFGLHGASGVHWHRLPSRRTVLEAVTDALERYPWIDDEAVDVLRNLAASPGNGFGGSPGAGRVAFTLKAVDIYNSLEQLYRAAIARGDDVEVLIVTCTSGGTSRGSLLEAGLLARRACPDAKVVRNVLVLPSFGVGAHPHEYRRRAANALTALRAIEEGMGLKERSFTGPDGTETITARLADEVVVVNPAYQADPQASVKAIEELGDVTWATARIVAGMAGDDRAWQCLADRQVDSTEERVEDIGSEDSQRIRWVVAVNEARVYFDDQRLMEGVRAGVCASTGASS